ncbi:MAG TPA: hypothetical protein VM146_17650 [Steroidobacteraceae bacterium]|nr:hypothetical protein [Steroidobacteraceae bacterium]
MNDDIATALRILAGGGLVILVSALCWLAVQAAKRGGKGMRAAGAMMMLFGWGHMRDPRNDTVAEANEGQATKGESAGDPPDRR